jgi:methyl-accepting chemotaxis protein
MRRLPRAAAPPVGRCLDTASRLTFLQAEFARLAAVQALAAKDAASQMETAVASTEVMRRDVGASQAASVALSELSEDVERHASIAASELSQATEAIERAHQLADALTKRSADLDGIVATIIDIAHSINLLVLNAKIEAVQAGELGRGFGVVADSVRELSVQTRDATDRAQLLLGATVRDVNESMTLVASAREMARRSQEHVTTAARAMHEVHRHSTDVRHAMTSAVVEVEQVSAAAATVNERVHDVAESAEAAATTVGQVRDGARVVLGASIELKRIGAGRGVLRRSVFGRLLDLTELVRGTTVHALEASPAEVERARATVRTLDRRITRLITTRRSVRVREFASLWAEYVELRDQALDLAACGRHPEALAFTAKHNRPKYQQVRALLTGDRA